MIFMLILVVLRKATGDTFFYHYGEGTLTYPLICNKATDTNPAVWYGGSSLPLLTFGLMNCVGKTQIVAENCAEKTDLCKGRNVSIIAFPAGGIFACKSLMMTDDGKTDDDNDCPLFSKPDHCKTYDFFIMAIINSTAEQAIFVKTSEPLKIPLSVVEKDNFTLSCEFTMKNDSNTGTFAVYWIKDTYPSACIFSVTNEHHSFSYDLNCCVNAAVEQRRVNNSALSDPLGPRQRHDVTIFNATPSDSGRYLCVVSVWSEKHVWKIASNVSVEVRAAQLPNSSVNWLLIAMGVIGGIVLISGITYFLFHKKKSKGKPSELQHERTQTTLELQQDECSPYAVSSRNDTEGNYDGVYSLAGRPGIMPPNGASSLPYGKTASKMPPGENVQALYARVNKQR